MSTPLAERFSLLAARGGWRAASFWLLRRGLCIDLFKVMCVQTARVAPALIDRPDTRLLVLRSNADLGACGADHLAVLDAHCGKGLQQALAGGERLYALVGTQGVLSQLTISFGSVVVDTPCDLQIRLPRQAAFLSYLHTPVPLRQAGWAARLIAQVIDRLHREGFARCYCHVQASNVRSINAFERAGWCNAGWLAATPGQRMLGTWRHRGHDLRIERPPIASDARAGPKAD